MTLGRRPCMAPIMSLVAYDLFLLANGLNKV